MGSLQNTFRHYTRDGRPTVGHFVPVGDALCHTNPMFALGLSQSIIHAFALASALDGSGDTNSATDAYYAAVESEAAERYALVRATDEDRVRMWRGEHVDFARRGGGAYQLFVLAAGAAARTARDISAPSSPRYAGVHSRNRCQDRWQATPSVATKWPEADRHER